MSKSVSNLDVSELLAELKTLRSSWAETRASAGGIAAMSGFEFQISKALCHIIEQVSKGRGTTFIEAISDAVFVDEGVIVAQAKRTLTSGSLHSALQELWQIEKISLSQTPKLSAVTKYRVQVARRALKDHASSIENWEPDGANLVQLKAFKKKVSIEVAPTPRNEAAKALIQYFKDPAPFERIDRYIGSILSSTADGFDNQTDQFVIELKALLASVSEREARFGLWGVSDCPPNATSLEPSLKDAVRIGERLIVSDLREGRLAARKVYDRIEHECERWLADHRHGYKIPMFWIAGRSGSGKSAALLHLASRLHSQNPDRVILWLADRVSTLGEAVRWAEPLIKEGRRLLILLDDPCTADRQADFAREIAAVCAEWERIQSRDLNPPTIICCGPTEQLNAADDLCGSQVECESFTLPIETAADLDELAVWFRARTGREALASDGNVLLVQQIFEWTKGSIPDFARRFRERLIDFDKQNSSVFNVVAKILALGRLYVNYPANALQDEMDSSASLDAALHQLAETETHFSFAISEGGGIRLTHPHLADAIYRQWFGKDADKPHRRRHLRDALTAALSRNDAPPEVRHAPLWAISRLAQAHDGSGRETDVELRKRVEFIQNELTEVLRNIYAGKVATLTPLQDLPVWVGLDEDLQLNLTPSPFEVIAEAVGRADVPVKGLRLSCHRLLGYGQDYGDRAKIVVGDALNRLSAWTDYGGPWHDWPPLALDYINRFGYEDIALSIDMLVANQPGWYRLSEIIYAVAKYDKPDARRIALGWLQGSPITDFGWSDILTALFETGGSCSEYNSLANRFLRAAANDDHWESIWRTQYNENPENRALYVDQGMAWLGIEQHPRFQAAELYNYHTDRVWQKLVEEIDDERRGQTLMDFGFEWVRTVDASHDGWTHMWPKIYDFYSHDDVKQNDLRQIAIEKFESAPLEMQGWSHVWNAAYTGDGSPTDLAIKSLGESWLTLVAPDHKGWGYVWEHLLDRCSGADIDVLKSLGMKWIDEVQLDHTSWPYVWKRLSLLADDAERMQLIAVGQQWLSDHHNHISWPVAMQAWKKANKDPQAFETLSHICMLWLENNYEGSERWPQVWRSCQVCGMDLARLLSFATEFLELHRNDHDQRQYLCGCVLTAVEDNPAQFNDFRSIACEIVQSAEYRKPWPYIWRSLNKRASTEARPALLAKGPPWLLHDGGRHPIWASVYISIFRAKRSLVDSPELTELLPSVLAKINDAKLFLATWLTVREFGNFLCVRSIRAQALRALKENREGKGWSVLLEQMIATSAIMNDVETLEIGLKWLRSSTEAKGWEAIYDAMRTRSGAQQKTVLDEIGVQYLRHKVSAPNWSILFESMVKDPDISRNDLAQAADGWLRREHSDDFKWGYVMYNRLYLEPLPWGDEAIVRRALTWLSGKQSAHRYWAKIWRSLRGSMPSATIEQIDNIAETWLASVDQNHSGWSRIWLDLWKSRRGIPNGRAPLRRLGRTWITANPRHPNFELVAVRCSTRNTKPPVS